jgi:FAD:protein FMN transferase
LEVDEETASLNDLASQYVDLSKGLFDMTAGVLRRAWTFDGPTMFRKPPQSNVCYSECMPQSVGE